MAKAVYWDGTPILPTISICGALKNQINAQKGKKISDEAAGLTIAYTNNLIITLLNQLPAGESC